MVVELKIFKYDNRQFPGDWSISIVQSSLKNISKYAFRIVECTKMPSDNPFVQDTAIIINLNKKRASISTHIRLTRK